MIHRVEAGQRRQNRRMKKSPMKPGGTFGRGDTGSAQSGSSEPAITKPEMTKNRSTPLPKLTVCKKMADTRGPGASRNVRCIVMTSSTA